MYGRLLSIAFVIPIVIAGASSSSRGGEGVLPQNPALGVDRIVFDWGGDLWTVPKQGGDAARLTAGSGIETGARVSPDGSLVAFTGEYDGNLDVFVVPIAGGEPKRITAHPDADVALGWSPDGKRVLFRSGRQSSNRFSMLFTVGLDGGLPEALPLPMGEQGALAPDGQSIAYVPFWNRRPTPGAYIAWKRYRGGKASPIWIAKLADSRVTPIPRTDSNDSDPIWVGDTLYFLSDRDGPSSLYRCPGDSMKVERVRYEGDASKGDILSAAGRGEEIVYERLGALHLLNLGSKSARKVAIRAGADLPALRPRYEKVGKSIESAALSPTGARAAFSSRGEILTVPAKKGDVRNLTQTAGIAERDPAWSPDGKKLAYFSDASGEYALHIRDQSGTGEPEVISLGETPSFFYSPVWSPDGSKIAYTDKRLKLWYLDLKDKKPVEVDSDAYDHPVRALDPTWSPDSRYIAYSKQMKNRLRAVFAYSLAEKKSLQLTDGQSDARYPVFDKSGDYIYFSASVDVGPTTGWLDMSSMNKPVTRSLYLIVLAGDKPSPLAPESDEEGEKKPLEKGKAAGDDKAKSEKPDKPPTPTVKIDPEGIDQRILALPIPPSNHAGLAAGKAGVLFILDQTPVLMRGPGGSVSLEKFDLKERKLEKLGDGLSRFDISADGSKLLVERAGAWSIQSADAPLKPGEGTLKTDAMEVKVDPRAEWRQMYREVWRIERDFLYDPNAHGLDLKAAEKAYEPYLGSLAGRSDLNYLFSDMLGEITLGHVYVGGGDLPETPKVKGGLLGADYRIAQGKYQFAKVYLGQNWNPELKAPLTQPGVNVKEGDFLLAVAGKPIAPPADLDLAFEASAGKAITIRVGPSADGAGARDVVVVPLDSESALRRLDWIEANRKRVDQLSGGKVAYVYLPDTAVGGFTFFNRHYFAQIDKEAAVLDERFNGGGAAADYIIDYLRRPLWNYWSTREGADFTTPVGSIFGPKAMIINEAAGSGGDAMPWYFRRAKIGPLVGKRTWGGLVGIYDYPRLIDGGMVTAPRLAFWSPDGDWDVENKGVAPDLEVELDPKAVREGRDPQLEKAVQVVLEELRKNPAPKAKKPAYPQYPNPFRDKAISQTQTGR